MARTIVVALVLLGWAAVTPAVRAQDAGSVALKVLVIRATTDHDRVDAELRPIANELKQRFKFTGFTLLKTLKGRAGMDKTWSGELTETYGLKITPNERKGERIKLAVEFLEKKGRESKPVLRSTITISAGKYQLFGGWKIDGDTLIVAVTGE